MWFYRLQGDKFLSTKSKQIDLLDPDVNNVNLNLPKNKQQTLLTAEEPRFVIIRKENVFPLKIGKSL